MKVFKKGAAELKGDKKKKKGRPTVKKDKEEEEKKKILNPKYKFLNMQMEKLENMYVVLTAEEGMSKLNK